MISTVSPVRATNPTESAICVNLTSGPFVSISIAILSDTFLTLSTTCCAPSMEAWAELIRTTFMPFSYNWRMKSSSQRLSAIVQIIFVLFSIIVKFFFQHTKLMNFGQSSRIVTVFLRIFVDNGLNHRGLRYKIQSPNRKTFLLLRLTILLHWLSYNNL